MKKAELKFDGSDKSLTKEQVEQLKRMIFAPSSKKPKFNTTYSIWRRILK